MEKQPLSQSETVRYHSIIFTDFLTIYPDKVKSFKKLNLSKDDTILAAEMDVSEGDGLIYQLYKNYYLSDLEDQYLFERFNKITNNEI